MQTTVSARAPRQRLGERLEVVPRRSRGPPGGPRTDSSSARPSPRLPSATQRSWPLRSTSKASRPATPACLNERNGEIAFPDAVDEARTREEVLELATPFIVS